MKRELSINRAAPWSGVRTAGRASEAEGKPPTTFLPPPLRGSRVGGSPTFQDPALLQSCRKGLRGPWAAPSAPRAPSEVPTCISREVVPVQYEEEKREQTPPRLALCPGPRGCRFQAQQEVAVAVGLSALPVHRSLASEGSRGSRVWRAMEWLAESHRVAEGLRVRGALTVHREPVHEAMSHPALRILKPL